jgi:hypothetical protein
MTLCRHRISLPADIELDNQQIIAGESLPMRLTVTKDGNGDDVESLSGFEIWVETRDASDNAVLLTFESTGEDPRVSISGTSAYWSWTEDETPSLPRRCIFYVYVRDPDGEVTILAAGFLTTLPL